MHNSPLVAVFDTLQELEENRLDLVFIHRFSEFVQVFLHILIEELENQEETVFIFSVHNLIQVNDMWVLLQLLKYGDFADCS